MYTLTPGQNDLTIYAGITLLPPTVVALQSFTAEWTSQSVRLRWVTTAELHTWGFQIYRSSDGTRANSTRRTPAIILGQGHGQSNALYTWTDTTVEPGQTYTYWLEEIEVNGTTNEYGPATTLLHPTSAGRQVFLALITH